MTNKELYIEKLYKLLKEANTNVMAYWMVNHKMCIHGEFIQDEAMIEQ